MRQVWTFFAAAVAVMTAIMAFPSGSAADPGGNARGDAGRLGVELSAITDRPAHDTKRVAPVDNDLTASSLSASAVDVCLGDDIVVDARDGLGPDLLMVRTSGACVATTSFDVFTAQTPYRIGIWMNVDGDPDNGCGGADRLLVFYEEIFAYEEYTLTGCEANESTFVAEHSATSIRQGTASGIAVSPGIPGPFAFDIGVFDAAGTVDWMDVTLVNGNQTISCDGLRIPGSPSGGTDGYWLSEYAGNIWSGGNAIEAGGACRSQGAVTSGGVADIAGTGGGWAAVHYDGHVSYSQGNAAARNVAPYPFDVGGRYAISVMNDPNGPVGSLRVVYDNGAVASVNGASFHGDLRNLDLNLPMIDAVPTVTGDGYWLIAEDGGVFAFGDAEFYGSMGGVDLNEPVLGMAPDPDGIGYWLVAADGGVFAFDAGFVGSIPGILDPGAFLNQPIIGMVSYGDAYLLVARDGGVFNFSNRAFAGSLGSNPPDTPITSILPTG